MTVILIVGVVIALVIFVIWTKVRGSEPKKAAKWEKADIMKQLLALSENENGALPIMPPARPRTVPAAPTVKAARFRQKPSEKVSKRVHANR